MSTTNAPAGFVRRNDRLAKMLADPDTRASVDEILAEQDQIDRTHAMTLATVRKAASLTQTELAQRLGVNQAAVSKLERRGVNDRSVLLSTLANYLTAAGATDVSITLNVAGQTITLPIAELLGAAAPADTPA